MIYSFGSFELDTRVYELRHAGHPRPVEPQVFDVLAYLVQNRERVISKEELLEQIWPDRVVSETTLTSRLKAARKAVGDTGKEQRVIRTQHGRGYRFVADVEERGVAGFVACTGENLVPTDRRAPEVLQPLLATRAPAVQPKADFVGRESELERLGAALDRALEGTRQIVFVAAEAGAGKTTLVETFLARRTATALIAKGQCLERRGSGEAYMPLLEALGRLCTEGDGRPVLEVLRRHAPSWLLQLPSVATEEDHAQLRSRTGSGERMLRELGDALQRLTGSVPLILVLEDLHWSDYATLDAVELLARQGGPARLLVIGTYRPADVKATRHPVHSLCQELRVRGQCELLSLPLLVPPDLARYMGLRFGDAPWLPDLVRALYARTAGNPLFVGNLVDSWVARGLLRRKEGGWELNTSLEALETDVPESLQELIEKQVMDLDLEQRMVLETASVIGRTFSVAAIAATVPSAEEDVERACETLVHEGRFLRVDGTEQWGDGTLTARFAFLHDLYPDVLYRRIPAVRRARLHHQVGLAVERAWSGQQREHAAELAIHFQRARDQERALRYLQLAAGQALDRSAYREAVLHLSGALEIVDAMDSGAGRQRTELTIRCRLAPALVATRGWADSEAESNYIRARELARELGDAPLLSQTLYGLATMLEYRGDYCTAEAIVNERLALDGTTAMVNVMESHELLTCSMLHQGRYQEAVGHGERVHELYQQLGELEGERLLLLVQAYGWVTGALYFSGRTDEALARSSEALLLAEQGGDEFAKSSAMIQSAFLRFYLRDRDVCQRLALASVEIARERRFPFHVACGRILNGWWLAGSGQHEEAQREIRAGIRTSSSIGARMDLPLFLAILADAQEKAGDRPGAEASLDEAIEIVRAGRSYFYAPELHRVRGHLLLAHEATRAFALEELRHAWILAEEQGSPVFALRALTSLTRFDPSAEWRKLLRERCDAFTQGKDSTDFLDASGLLQFH